MPPEGKPEGYIDTKICFGPARECRPARAFTVTIGLRCLPLGGWLKAEGDHIVFAHPVGDTKWEQIPGMIASWVEKQATRPDGSPVIMATAVKEVAACPDSA